MVHPIFVWPLDQFPVINNLSHLNLSGNYIRYILIGVICAYDLNRSSPSYIWLDFKVALLDSFGKFWAYSKPTNHLVNHYYFFLSLDIFAIEETLTNEQPHKMELLKYGEINLFIKVF